MSDRFALLGRYKTPRVRVGDVLMCECRDHDVIVCGFTDAKIPWPLGRKPGTSGRGPILFGDLADAVRRESNQAVCHWFGVTPQTVSKWRKALDVPIATEGTSRLHFEAAHTPALVEARKKAVAKNQDPERRAKIAAARRGVKRSPETVAKMVAGRLGRKVSAKTRAKMSASQKRKHAERRSVPFPPGHLPLPDPRSAG